MQNRREQVATVFLQRLNDPRFEQNRDYWKIRATELAGNGRRCGAN